MNGVSKSVSVKDPILGVCTMCGTVTLCVNGRFESRLATGIAHLYQFWKNTAVSPGTGMYVKVMW